MSHNPDILATKFNPIVRQQENAARTRTINWSSRIGSDTISSSTWTAETSGLTIANEANDTTTTSARFSATPGRYLVTNKVVLAGGDTEEFQLVIEVMNNDRSLISDYHNCNSYH